MVLVSAMYRRRWRTPRGTDSSTDANVSYTHQPKDAAVFAIVRGWPAAGAVTLLALSGAKLYEYKTRLDAAEAKAGEAEQLKEAEAACRSETGAAGKAASHIRTHAGSAGAVERARCGRTRGSSRPGPGSCDDRGRRQQLSILVLVGRCCRSGHT